MAHVLGDATLVELERGLDGSVIRPGDAAYDEARRVWNHAIDRRPALIVRAATVDDVVRTVRFCSSEGLRSPSRRVASVAGFSTCDDGVVIDLGAMTDVAVDPPPGGRAGGARPGPPSTPPPRSTGWPPPAALDSPASAGSPRWRDRPPGGPTASPATTSSRPRS